MSPQRRWFCALTVTCTECGVEVTFTDVGSGVAAVTNGLVDHVRLAGWSISKGKIQVDRCPDCAGGAS